MAVNSSSTGENASSSPSPNSSTPPRTLRATKRALRSRVSSTSLRLSSVTGSLSHGRRGTTKSVGAPSYCHHMRILHTSDWHLGRSFHGVGMLDAQASFLDHLVETVAAEDVDLVVVAGDVYDRALPPVDAVEVAGDALARLSETGARTVVTSGNHDSPVRLGSNARLADAAGVHLRTRWQDVGTPVLVEDQHGVVAVHGLPYLEPDAVRQPW